MSLSLLPSLRLLLLLVVVVWLLLLMLPTDIVAAVAIAATVGATFATAVVDSVAYSSPRV